ncbi:MAG TPA: type II toxin-antitoxin system prevent-host-death family antitoxin [Pirellulales bacterium]|nr:type II toxin-antitoxin system prevent-host-death family antitoxin [Pirellulales bacterium]
MPITNIHEAEAQLSRLVDRALAGEEVVIARAGHPLVRLTPLEHDMRPRQGGQLRGQLWVAEDFDAADPDIEALFYDGKP